MSEQITNWANGMMVAVEQRLLHVRDILAAAPEPWEAHLSPENRGALERLGMDVADAAIHRAMQEAK
jgi:hypothetical protein